MPSKSPLEIVIQAAGTVTQHFGGGAVVGIVVDRNVVAGVFGFALRPDFFRAIRIIFVGKNEVKALFGLAIVADEDFVRVAALGRSRELHDQIIGRDGKFGVVAVERYSLDIQSDRVELDLW